MANVTGNAYTVASGPKSALTHVSAQLAGYGSQNPRINGTGIFTGIKTLDLEIDNVTGLFTVQLYGNDIIAPAGTYYVFTFANENGDIIQVNAYRFIDGQPYDLNLLDPYDPNQPPPPFPPLITNLLLPVGAADDMIFPGDTYTAFTTILPGDVTHPVVEGMVAGNLYTFIIKQDATGGHLLLWPSNVHNATRIMPTPNSTTVQTFVADGNGDLWAIGPGTWSA
jgi:hypothetical protein